MKSYIKKILTCLLLTYLKKVLVFLLRKFNTPVVPTKGSITNGSKKGIITLTLVISRCVRRPAVIRGLCVMNLKFLSIKTKLQYQVEEYIAWKKERGIDVTTWGTISKFTEFNFAKKSIEEITPEDIQKYYEHIITTENTKYFIQLGMKDVRVMFRWFKARKYKVVEPDLIGEEGLTIKSENAIIEDMTAMKRMGRPPKTKLIEKVKSLRDINKLSFREIARVVKKDVSQVHVWYYYDLKE